MPELPEVETIRGQLAPLVEGRTLVRDGDPRPALVAPAGAGGAAAALEGRRVERLGRRGKYLLWRFSDEAYLAQHLRMTGSVLLDPEPEPRAHARARWTSSRRAARWRSSTRGASARASCCSASEAMEAFFAARLGLEPLRRGLHGRAPARRSRAGASAPIKAFLLDQRQIAGVGNIYADEALFRARIHPRRPAGRLTREQYALLRDGDRSRRCSAGIDARGASIDDFRHVDGVRGAFQDRFLVHLREGEPCVRCGTTIVKMVVAGRGTYVCEHCQPRPRLRTSGTTGRRPARAARVRGAERARRAQAASSSSRRPSSAACCTSA